MSGTGPDADHTQSGEQPGTDPSPPPPGWYPDPLDGTALRRWDGAAWTALVRTRPPQASITTVDAQPASEILALVVLTLLMLLGILLFVDEEWPALLAISVVGLAVVGWRVKARDHHKRSPWQGPA
jgi:hypothetical protein